MDKTSEFTVNLILELMWPFQCSWAFCGCYDKTKEKSPTNLGAENSKSLLLHSLEVINLKPVSLGWNQDAGRAIFSLVLRGNLFYPLWFSSCSHHSLSYGYISPFSVSMITLPSLSPIYLYLSLIKTLLITFRIYLDDAK